MLTAAKLFDADATEWPHCEELTAADVACCAGFRMPA
jgi:hypothetical protein